MKEFCDKTLWKTIKFHKNKKRDALQQILAKPPRSFVENQENLTTRPSSFLRHISNLAKAALPPEGKFKNLEKSPSSSSKDYGNLTKAPPSPATNSGKLAKTPSFVPMNFGNLTKAPWKKSSTREHAYPMKAVLSTVRNPSILVKAVLSFATGAIR